jgi:hypothetical protein
MDFSSFPSDKTHTERSLQWIIGNSNYNIIMQHGDGNCSFFWQANHLPPHPIELFLCGQHYILKYFLLKFEPDLWDLLPHVFLLNRDREERLLEFFHTLPGPCTDEMESNNLRISLLQLSLRNNIVGNLNKNMKQKCGYIWKPDE